jgi:hypothetical protein
LAAQQEQAAKARQAQQEAHRKTQPRKLTDEEWTANMPEHIVAGGYVQLPHKKNNKLSHESDGEDNE